MALTKPPVLPPWAEAGDKVQPTNAELQTGWPLSNTPPARQRWNWILNFLANGIRYLTRRGMPDYGADETYMIGDRVIGDDGKTYRSIQDNNTGNAPSASPLWWERWGFSKSELTAELNNHDYKDSCRVATTANLAALSGLLTIDGVVLVAGDRVLVKDQAVGSQNGIYVAAVGAWSRATDCDENSEVTGGLIAPVVEGATNGDSLWLLTNDGAVTIGVTALTFKSISQTDTGVTQPQFTNNTKLATTAFVKAGKGGTAGLNAFNVSTTLALADVGKQIFFCGSTAAQTLTLPDASTVAAGEGYWITNQASVAVTLKGNGAQNLSVNLAGSGQSLTNTTVLKPGDSVFVPSNGVSQWNIHGYTSDSQFPSSLAASGYQKLPSGLIIQWGVNNASPAGSAVTFPITFPASCYVVTTGVSSTGAVNLRITALTTVGFTFWRDVQTDTHFWIAIGK